MSENKTGTDVFDENMGCCTSQKVHPEVIQEKQASESLSNIEVEIVQSNWKSVEQDPQGNGLLLFRRLFQENPDVKSKFYFALENNLNLEDIMVDERLANHAKGVMDTISVAVSLLHDLATLVPVLKQLGGAHAKFQLQDEHFKAVGSALLWTIENAMGCPLDDAAQRAWIKLFGFVTENMKKGFLDVEKESERV